MLLELKIYIYIYIAKNISGTKLITVGINDYF